MEKFNFLSLSQDCDKNNMNKKHYVYQISYNIFLGCSPQKKIFENLICRLVLRGLPKGLTNNMSATVDFIQESNSSRIEFANINQYTEFTRKIYTVGNLEIYANISKLNLHAKAMVKIIDNSEFIQLNII